MNNAIGKAHPRFVRQYAVIIPPIPMTEPTDRSRPPLIKTMVIPAATIPVIDILLITFSRFLAVRKYGLRNDKMRHSTMRVIIIPKILVRDIKAINFFMPAGSIPKDLTVLIAFPSSP
jgi:hypothetical protein